jgi:ribonucleoside-diphosphate reductase alpha chain
MPEFSRKESWEESVKDVMSMHYNKFATNAALKPHLDFATQMYAEGKVLASQRNLQYREEQILKANTRLFNCASTYIDRPEVFKEIMYVLLCGCGMGYSVENRFIDKLPRIQARTEDTETHIIEDSIEGWANALHALMQSFFEGTAQIRFDGSLVRAEGAFISGGFKAPGYEPLKKSLEMIEKLLQDKIAIGDYRLSSLDSHEVICIASDSVLAAGVRRSALICLFDKDDKEMMNCKTDDWWYKKPWLARANNSVKLMKGEFSKEEFNIIKDKIKEFGEPGLAMVTDMGFTTNPCFEIGFIPVNPRTGKTCISFCNLTEINGAECTTKEKFLQACIAATIIGTLQASYTNMPFLSQDTKELIEGEALIGVSITGIMDNPHILLDPATLREGAELVKATNAMIALLIGINPAARTTCVKPSGNASVLLKTSSGIHPSHAKNFFRIITMNKGSEMAGFLKQYNSVILENSVNSAQGNDYSVYIPITEPKGAITKDQLKDVEFADHVKTVFQNWVLPGTNIELGYSSKVTHNVSNTITVQDWDAVFDYIYDNQDSFCGLSFLHETGDKVYKQAPFTKVLTFEELIADYGESSVFASGLVVDAMHAFNGDLWDACEAARNKDFPLSGDRFSVLLKKDTVRRIKKFSKNYHKGNIETTNACLKDVYLFHKWVAIKREFKTIDFSSLDMKPSYTNVAELGGVACNADGCEITSI